MTKRTFIAITINPTEEMLRRIHYLKKNLIEENINWIKEAHLHITLRFLGYTPADKLKGIEEELQKTVARFKRIDLSLSGIHLFGSKHSPKVIWIGVEPTETLKKWSSEIDKALAPLGFGKDRQNFVPHITIARIRKLKDKDFFNKVMSLADQTAIQVEQVEGIIFYESVLKNTGAEYSVLKVFDLGK